MPAEDDAGRLPHASADEQSRMRKAEKLTRLIEAECSLADCDVLEVGAGSGHISAHLAERAKSVSAVDVVDVRTIEEGFDYQRVDGTVLPFADASFDVAVSNHVIEHVGELPDQRRHLEEISRVLRPGGLLYLATPNRWDLVEPHYKLPLLSWLPRGVRSSYVRLTRRGDWFDVEPLERKTLLSLFGGAGLVAQDRTWEAATAMADLETLSLPQRLVLAAPRGVLALVGGLVPSLIYIARRPADDQP